MSDPNRSNALMINPAVATSGILREPRDFSSLQPSEGMKQVTFELPPQTQKKEEEKPNQQSLLHQ